MYNPNLIYVKGKGYKEDDLQDMIEYYHNNFKYDLHLPVGWNLDATSQILKYYPFYTRISKSVFRHHLFYNQYHYLDITSNEFINYVVNEQVNQFTFIIFDDDINVNCKIYNFITKNDDYILKKIEFEQDDIQIYKRVKFHKHKIDHTLKNIFNCYNIIKIIYDLTTVKSIYHHRKNCQQYNHLYNQEMTQLYLNQLISDIPQTINNSNQYSLYFIYYLYLLYNLQLDQEVDFFTKQFRSDEIYLDNINEFLDQYQINHLLKQIII
jgi:hypothetical protein